MARVLLWALAIALCAFLVLPALVVIPLSLDSSRFLVFPPPGWSLKWYQQLLTDPDWIAAIVRTIVIALAVVVLSAILGTCAAYALSRSRRRWLRSLEPIFVLPLIVPTVVYAAGAYIAITDLHLQGALWMVVLAHTVAGQPFMFLSLMAAFRTMDERLEIAAQSLGAPRWKAFMYVTLPIISPAVVAGAVFVGLFSLDEVVLALFLAPDATPTFPVKMYSSIQYALDPHVPVGATLMLAITIAFGLIGLSIYRFAARRSRSNVRTHPPELSAEPVGT